MAASEHISAVVVSYQGTPANVPAFATAVSYTADVNIPGHDQPVRLSGIVPTIWRWRAPLKIRPWDLVGRTIGGWRIGGMYQWDFIESPDQGSCPP